MEKCKQKDLLEQTMSEMIGEFPALHQTIVAERDIYLTHTLRQLTRCVEAPSSAQSNYHTSTQQETVSNIGYWLGWVTLDRNEIFFFFFSVKDLI